MSFLWTLKLNLLTQEWKDGLCDFYPQSSILIRLFLFSCFVLPIQFSDSFFQSSSSSVSLWHLSNKVNFQLLMTNNVLGPAFPYVYFILSLHSVKLVTWNWSWWDYVLYEKWQGLPIRDIFLFHLTKFYLKVARKIAQIKLLRGLLFCIDMVLFVFIGFKVAQLTFHSNVIAWCFFKWGNISFFPVSFLLNSTYLNLYQTLSLPQVVWDDMLIIAYILPC